MAVEKLKFKVSDIIKFPDISVTGKPEFLEASDPLIHIASKKPLADPGKLFTTIRGYKYRYMQADKNILYGQDCDMVSDTVTTPVVHTPGQMYAFNYISYCDIPAGHYGLLWQVEPLSQAIGSGGYGTTIIMDPDAVPTVTIYKYVEALTSKQIHYTEDPLSESLYTEVLGIDYRGTLTQDQLDHSAANTLRVYAPVDNKKLTDDENPTILDYINAQIGGEQADISALENKVDNLSGENLDMSPTTSDLCIKDYVDYNEMGFTGENLQMYGDSAETIEETVREITDLDLPTLHNDIINEMHEEMAALNTSLKEYADNVGTSVTQVCDNYTDTEIGKKTGANIPIGVEPSDNGSIKKYIDSLPQPATPYLSTIATSPSDTTLAKTYVDSTIALPVNRYEFFNIGHLATRDPMSMAFNTSGSCYTTEVCLQGTSSGTDRHWVVEFYHARILKTEIQGMLSRAGITFNLSESHTIPNVSFGGLECSINIDDISNLTFIISSSFRISGSFTYKLQDDYGQTSQNLQLNNAMYKCGNENGSRPMQIFNIFNYKNAMDYLNTDELGGYIYTRFVFEHMYYRMYCTYTN
jgi:hypothetical protein